MTLNPDWELASVFVLFSLAGAFAIYMSRGPGNSLSNRSLRFKGKLMLYIGIVCSLLSLVGPQN